MTRADDRFAIWSLLLVPLNRSVFVGHEPRHEYSNFGHGTRERQFPVNGNDGVFEKQGFPSNS
jgi:hypothetical protein